MKILSMASAAAVALLVASAASAQDSRIAFGDLDLGSERGAAQFDRRVIRAARSACSGGTPLEATACVARFRAEALRLLPTQHRDEYARARGGRVLAMVPAVYG